MAVIKNPKDIKIFIDGFEIADLATFQMDVDTYKVGPFAGDYFSHTMRGRSNVTVKLETLDGIELKFFVEGKETDNEGNIYFYGPLRKLLPSLFVDRDLLPWQVTYLEFMGRPSLDRFKLLRDDGFFLTDTAKAYFHGYDRGKSAGIQYGREEEKRSNKKVK